MANALCTKHPTGEVIQVMTWKGDPVAGMEMSSSLSKHMGDGKVKLGRGPYAISTAILSMYPGFQHPRTKYMLAPGPRKLTFLCVFSCGFAKWSI